MTVWGMDILMTAWGMDIPCIIQRMCEKARFPYRHPERSRGIFFVGGKMESAREGETGNTASQKRWEAVLSVKGLAKEEENGG